MFVSGWWTKSQSEFQIVAQVFSGVKTLKDVSGCQIERHELTRSRKFKENSCSKVLVCALRQENQGTIHYISDD